MSHSGPALVHSDEPDVPCECVLIDVDLVDASGCPLHCSGGAAERAIAEYRAVNESSKGEIDCPF